MEFDCAVVHQPCPDGEAARIVLRDKFGPRPFPILGFTHGVSKVDEAWAAQFTGQRLLCADWCPSMDGLKLLAKVAKTVTVVDHHRTALPILDNRKQLPTNVALFIQSPHPAACTALYRLLQEASQNGAKENGAKENGVQEGEKRGTKEGEKEGEKNNWVPGWLRVIDLHDTGRFGDMTPEDSAVHAALTDDLANLDEQRRKPWDELEKRGRFLLDVHRPMVAKALIAKAETKPFSFGGKQWVAAYVDVTHEKFIHATNTLFWQQTEESKNVDLLALRFPQNGGKTDFKLRRPPSSQLDLSNLAATYAAACPGASGGGHAAAAGLQLPNAPKFIPDLPSQ